MNYNPKTWYTGETITSTGLNNIQNGILNNNIFFIGDTLIDDSNNIYQLNETFKNIEQIASSRMVILNRDNSGEGSIKDFYFLVSIEKTENSPLNNDNIYVLGFRGGPLNGFISYSTKDKENRPTRDLLA